MHTPLAHQRLDQIYDSEIINLRNIKIVSNHATNIENVILYENAETAYGWYRTTRCQNSPAALKIKSSITKGP